jgi:hypothetical protein
MQSSLPDSCEIPVISSLCPTWSGQTVHLVPDEKVLNGGLKNGDPSFFRDLPSSQPLPWSRLEPHISQASKPSNHPRLSNPQPLSKIPRYLSTYLQHQTTATVLEIRRRQTRLLEPDHEPRFQPTSVVAPASVPPACLSCAVTNTTTQCHHLVPDRPRTPPPEEHPACTETGVCSSSNLEILTRAPFDGRRQ